ncbi:MAG: RNA polymerase sigma factor, partial [Candidatus Bathyarchaeia archaeon]
MRRCVAGEKEAWDLFVLKYSRLVHHAIYQVLSRAGSPARPEVADDLYQEVFASLLTDGRKKLRQFRGKNGCSLASWIRMIAARKALDYLRRECRSPSCFEEPEILENMSGDCEEDPEGELIRSEERRMMRGAIAMLQPRHRLFVELYYHRGLSISEISQIMNLEPNGV